MAIGSSWSVRATRSAADGEPAHRPQAVGRHRPPGEPGQHHAGDPDHPGDQRELLEGLVGGLHRLRQHQRLDRADRHRRDPVAGAVDVDGADGRVGAAARDVDLLAPDVLVDRLLRVVARELAPVAHDGDAYVGGRQRPAGELVVLDGRQLGRLGGGTGPLHQRVVQRRLELAAQGQVDRNARHRQRQADGEGREDGDPRGERDPRGEAVATAGPRAVRAGLRGHDVLMARSRAARSRPRAPCAAAGTRCRPRSCGAGIPRRPRASSRWWGSRSPRPPRG